MVYLILMIDPLSQPGNYNLVTAKTFKDVVEVLKYIIHEKLKVDPDFIKIDYNEKILNDIYNEYCEYIDKNISIIEEDPIQKFTIKYYGYFIDQKLSNIQYDMLYNVHNLG